MHGNHSFANFYVYSTRSLRAKYAEKLGDIVKDYKVNKFHG